MTVNSEVSRVSYIGDDSTTNLSVPFKFFSEDDLLVTVVDSDGAETTLVLDTDYTVTGEGIESGGEIDLAEAVATGSSITIRLRPATLQPVSIRNQTDFYQETHENAFDRVVKIAQAQQDELDRSLKLPETEAGSAAATILPPVVDRASQFLGFDASGNPIAASSFSSGVVASSFMQTVLDDTTAGAALTTLGISSYAQTLLDDSSGLVAQNTLLLTGRTTDDAVVQVCQGRLTLTSATPITTGDVSAATTLYFTPYMGNKVTLYDGTRWLHYAFTETSIALSAATNANRPYDVFVYNNSGTITLELVSWTNSTTRATALAIQNGIEVKSGSTNKLYLGTVYTKTAGQVSDAEAFRHVWNRYNQVERPMKKVDTTDTWTYNSATLRQANGTATNQLDYVVGLSEIPINAKVVAGAAGTTAATNGLAGIGVDSTTTNSATLASINSFVASSTNAVNVAEYRGYPGIGRHVLTWIEWVPGANTVTFIGDNGTSGVQCGIMGTVMG